MKSSSCKAKGRGFQQQIIRLLHTTYPEIEEGDLVNRSSGSNGEDIIMSPKARSLIGNFSIECKHLAVGYSKVYQALEQAENQNKGISIAFLKNNRKRAIMAMYAEDFLNLSRRSK